MLEILDTFISLLIGLTVFAVGACIGSFLNVVVYRIPAKLSLLWPPSRCPNCLQRLRPTENVPVLGWLWLRGRCSHCKCSISSRYPLVEAATGLVFLWVFGTFHWSVFTLGYWAFFSWLLALSLIDLDTLTLPNPLTQSGLVAGLLFQGIVGATVTDGIPERLLLGVEGMVLGLWLLDLIRLLGSWVLGEAAMGDADAKLAAMMGAWLGWKLLLLAAFLACAIGAIVGGGAIALGLLSRRQPMPFGPYLALGAVLAAVWGERLLSAYFQLMFRTL